jgi:hypothetical protein
MAAKKNPRKSSGASRLGVFGATALELPVPSPITGLAVGDVQAEFAKITRATPRDPQAEQAFIAARLHMIRTHPTLHPAEREAAAALLISKLKKVPLLKIGAPVPGGVGYGMFYNTAFKTNFSTATAIYWEIICPNPRGGNVNTFLYLTATNRSSLGVEAFISYNGQNQTFLKVFDWARYPAAPWQTNIPFANLAAYLRTESSHGHPYQVLPLINVTSQSGTNHWYNQVWLWNHVANRWDLAYQYGYAATLQQQQAGWVGSWEPIVETFQNAYTGTRPMGALSTQCISKTGNQWGAWHFLSAADGYVRTDNKGFRLLFLDANYNWAVNS